MHSFATHGAIVRLHTSPRSLELRSFATCSVTRALNSRGTRPNSLATKPIGLPSPRRTLTTANPPANNKIITIPNALTMSRIAATPLIGHFIMNNNLTPALGVFAYCCVTDFLDGYIARRYNLGSAAGTILDPMADKLLMLVTTLAMTLPQGPAIIPLPIAALIIGRDAGLAVAGFVMRYTSMRRKYSRVTWDSYWNFFKYPSAEVKPTQISKWNTFLQMIYLGTGVIVLIAGEDEEEQKEGEEEDSLAHKRLLTAFSWLGYIVGGTTVLSGASYMFSKNAVKFLKP